MGRMLTYIDPAKELNIYGEFEVIVVGCGCAGLAAATASARNGARTLIIERFPYFGGTATASLMANINGFRNQVEPDGLQTTKGIGEEIVLKLKDIGGIGEHSQIAYPKKIYPDTKGNLTYCFSFDVEKFKYVALKLVKESGSQILFHTYFSDIIKVDGRVAGIIIENKSGRQAVFGKIVIDASGDGDAACKAGASFWQTKGSEEKRLVDSLMYKINGFQEESSTGGCRCNGSMVVWGPTPGPINGADSNELTAGEIKARLAVYDDFDNKKKKDAGLQNACIVETGPLLGIRQTRFIEGLYKITGEDVIEGRRFEDSIAMASSPIINFYGYRRFLEHEGYEIPYRCLLPRDVHGLIVAGRCISSDQRAFESWRAMAHIFAIGEAAGTAAALSAINNIDPAALDIKQLQGRLIEQGAEIGQGRCLKK